MEVTGDDPLGASSDAEAAPSDDDDEQADSSRSRERGDGGDDAEQPLADDAGAAEAAAAPASGAEAALDLPLGARPAAAGGRRTKEWRPRHAGQVPKIAEEVFTVGFDMQSEEEVRKREARAAKYGGSEQPDAAGSRAMKLPEADMRNKLGARSTAQHGQEAGEFDDEAERAARERRAKKYGVELVDDERLRSVVSSLDIEKILEMTPNNFARFTKLDEKDERKDPGADVARRRDALHLYGYMPISTADIMGAFRGYGPSYIEWINATSANVVFGDSFSCSRAMGVFSSALPESSETEAIAACGWRIGPSIVAAKTTREYGLAGQEARLLVRQATEEDVKHYKQGKRKPKRRRDRDGAGAAAAIVSGGIAAAEAETSAIVPKKLKVGRKGRFQFNEDGSISTAVAKDEYYVGAGDIVGAAGLGDAAAEAAPSEEGAPAEAAQEQPEAMG